MRKRGKLTFAELAANIGKVAPMARAAGMSMEDMMAAIATMTRQGLGTDEASTRLVNILKNARTQAVIPIRREQEVIGIVLLESLESETYPAETQAFLSRLSDHAAIAIARDEV